MTEQQTIPYRQALAAAKDAFSKATIRLDQVRCEEWALTQEITKLRRTITALAALCGGVGLGDDLGITDSCAEVMDAQKSTVTTVDVIKALDEGGFDLASQKNAAASVHAVLTRLARKGKIEKIEEEGQPVRWKGPNYDPDYDDVPF